MLLLGFIFFALAEFELGLAQRSSSGCSRDRMRQCSDMLQRNTQRRIVDMGRSEMSSQCMNVREDFNCLLRETRCLTSENERNRNGDTLRNALKYLRDGCDSNGGSWRDSNCYVGDTMKTCESSYPLGGVQYGSYTPETCRKFTLFQDCVTEAVRNRCQRDDEKLMGQYLVDTAQDLAWNCGESSSTTSDWDRNRDDRYDRDRYDRNGGDRDRDRDRDRSRGDSWRDRDRGYSSRDRDFDRSSDRYDRNGGYDRDRNYDRDGSSSGTCCRNERCSTSRLQQCRDSLSRAVEARSSGNLDSQKCRQIQDDFNCLLWQTSNCASRNDKDRDNDLFRRGLDFMSRNCVNYGKWSENSCYKSNEMTRCERSLPSTRSGATYESCRSYLSFRDCMEEELRRRCTREDDLYQGAYLMDKAQELSWQCGDDQQGYNGRNQEKYYTDNRRDSYDSDRYDAPEHLEDDDAMCLSRIQAYNDQCKAKLDEKRKDLYTTNEYEGRQRINCCSAREYRSCLFDATRRVCQSERTRVVDSLMGRHSYELSSDNCRRIYDSDCNSGTHIRLSTMLLLLCAVILPISFLTHFK